MSKRPGSEVEQEVAGGEDKKPRLGDAGTANGNVQQPDPAKEPTEQAFVPPPEGTLRMRYNFVPLEQLQEVCRHGTKFVEIILPGEACINSNKQVKQRQLWGPSAEGLYTHDSDVAAALMQAGFICSATSAAAAAQVATVHALLSLHMCKPGMTFPSMFRNSVRSRSWYGAMDPQRSCAYKVERCWLVSRGGVILELSAWRADQAVTHATFQPCSADRPMALRSAASTSRTKNMQEVAVLYNLVNEPWLKYSSMAIADRGLKSSHWTSARLRAEVLYLETARERYELAYVGPSSGEGGEPVQDTYTLSRCKEALPLALMKARGIPAPLAEQEVLEEGLAWEDCKWGNSTLQVRGRELKLLRINFFQRTTPPGTTPPPAAGGGATPAPAGEATAAS